MYQDTRSIQKSLEVVYTNNLDGEEIMKIIPFKKSDT